MSDDPIAAMLRADAARLLDDAPPLHTAATWHAIRRARARRMQRALAVCAWVVRLLVAVAVVIVALIERAALAPALAVALLVLWLAAGIAPLFDQSYEGGKP